MSYMPPALGSYDADFGTYQGRPGDPRNDDSDDIETCVDMAHTYLGTVLELLGQYEANPTRDYDEQDARCSRVNGLLAEARLMLKGLEL